MIAPHEGNGYRDPSSVRYAGGALYFAGYAENVLDLYSGPTQQVFVVGPAPPGSDPGLPGDFNHDGTVDSGDYVTLRKQGGSPEGFALWGQNFGRSASTGTGSALAATAAGNSLSSVEVPEVQSVTSPVTRALAPTPMAGDQNRMERRAQGDSDMLPAPNFYQSLTATRHDDTINTNRRMRAKAGSSRPSVVAVQSIDLLLAEYWNDAKDDAAPSRFSNDDAETFDAEHCDETKSFDDAFSEFESAAFKLQ